MSRLLAAMSFGWTDGALVAGMAVAAVHVTELRTALQAAYNLSAPRVPGGWSRKERT
jgi:hypothetical protein